MSVVTRKVVRQKLMQGAVLDKIEREHLLMNTDRVRNNLQSICGRVSGTSLHRCLDQWERIVEDNDVGRFRRIVESDGEHAREMRNLSPLSILLSEDERLQVLARLWAFDALRMTHRDSDCAVKIGQKIL